MTTIVSGEKLPAVSFVVAQGGLSNSAAGHGSSSPLRTGSAPGIFWLRFGYGVPLSPSRGILARLLFADA
jgi:hypothetical protein